LTGDALHNQTAAQIGLDQTLVCPFDGLTQISVGYSFPPGEPRKPFRFISLHLTCPTL
jgi:hypothetical protein